MKNMKLGNSDLNRPVDGAKHPVDVCPAPTGTK